MARIAFPALARPLARGLATTLLVAACGQVDADVPPTCVPPSPNPEAWWRGENNADDAIGRYPGALHGDAGFAIGGVHRGFFFDGTDDYVAIDHRGALYPEGSFSFEAWLRTTGVNSTIVSMYECGGSSCDDWSALGIGLHDDGHLALWVRDTRDKEGGAEVESDDAVNDGELHHVALVRDVEHRELRIYVDGVPDGSLDKDQAPDTTFGPLMAGTTDDDPLMIGAGIGTYAEAPSGYFAGVIDELTYYKTALTDDEVRALHGAGAFGKCVPH